MTVATSLTHRKHTKAHDYRSRCIYHITLVVSGREPILGRIVGENEREARIETSPLGNAVSQCIKSIVSIGAKHGRRMKILAKAIMPEHIHFVLFVEEPMDKPLGEVVRSFKSGCNKALREVMERCLGREGLGHNVPRPTNGDDAKTRTTNINGDDAKTRTANINGDDAQTRTANNNGNDAQTASAQTGDECASLLFPLDIEGTTCHRVSSPRILQQHALFEEDYDETILRRKNQLRCMIDYVHDNPRRRWIKGKHLNLLVPVRGIVVAGRSYDAIGNIMLLALGRQQVHVRSRFTETERRDYMNGCVIAARKNKVLVSPFISEYEKKVRDVALQEGHSIIQLMDNGFAEKATASGSLFDYCSNGQVLLLAPWKHEPKKGRISREECVMLNNMAEEIAEEK